MAKPATTDSDSRALRPESRTSLTIVQLVILCSAIGGAGFSVGALYPRLEAAENKISNLSESQRTMAMALVEVVTTVKEMKEAHR
jgi:hypothetical protein